MQELTVVYYDDYTGVYLDGFLVAEGDLDIKTISVLHPKSSFYCLSTSEYYISIAGDGFPPDLQTLVEWNII